MSNRNGCLAVAAVLLVAIASGTSWAAPCTTDAECNDDNVCNGLEACVAGVCTSSSGPNCDDGNSCTDDICDPVLGCVHANNSSLCTDGNACTTNDVCRTGFCVGGNTAPGCASCAAVATIPAGGGTFVGTTSGTSNLAGTCGSSVYAPERVYQWTPSFSGPATIQTCDTVATTYDTVLYVRRGSCASGIQVACNDDTSGCGTSTTANRGSRLTTAVTAGETYYIAVDGYGTSAGTYTLTVVPPSECGNDSREGQEECDGTDSSSCVSGACTAVCTCVPPEGGLPDLVPHVESLVFQFGAVVAAGDVAEGCAESRTGVDLLRFTAKTRNAGTRDLHIGPPLCPSPCVEHPLEVCGNPNFICSPAEGHNHAHYDNYARYDLLDATGQSLVVGHKQGFCLLDSDCTAAQPKYNCGYQGITQSCADVYAWTLGCQYLDITGVPSGSYTLQVTVDPFSRIAELDETNNVAKLSVVIPPRPGDTPVPTPGTPVPTPTAASNACGSAVTVPAGGGVFTGTTSGPSTLTGACGFTATSAAGEKVFAWTPNVSGPATIETCSTAATAFDTVLYLLTGTCGVGSAEIACNDDTSGCGTTTDVSNPHRGSRLTPVVTAGQTYYVVVDGFFAAGDFRLSIVPPSPPVPTVTPGGPTPSPSPVPTATPTAGSSCGTAIVLPPQGGVFTGATNGASEVGGTCGFGGTAAAPEQVFAWTPASTGQATIETCGATTTAFDTVLYVREGSCGNGAELACNDDTSGCGTTDLSSPNRGSRVTPLVTAGQTYYIVVDGFYGASGPFQLAVVPPLATTPLPTPTVPVAPTPSAASSNACDSPTVIPAEGGLFAGMTDGGSTISGSCGFGGSSAAPERVFAWTPTRSGTASIETCGPTATSFDTILYLREGTCDSGAELACNDDTPGCGTTTDAANPHRGSRVAPVVTAGVTYYIVVDGFFGANGYFALTVTPPQ